MILTVTPNPCVDKTVFLDRVELGTFMRARRFSCVPGGKGNNVARAVHAMDRDVRAMVVVGGHTGRHVVDMIENEDAISTLPVWVESPTRTITTVLEEPIHRQTAFFEPGPEITLAEYSMIIETFAGAVGRAQVATLCGTVSDPGTAELYREMINLAKRENVPVILDSHGPEFAAGLRAAPYMVKPNVAEASALLGVSLDTRDAQWRALDQFHVQGVVIAVMSLGKEGALVSCEGRRFHVIPPVIQEVNPVGSGDCFVAGFAIGIEEGMSLEEMARLGCAMGAANAMTWNIGHFEPEQVDQLLPQVQLRPY